MAGLGLALAEDCAGYSWACPAMDFYLLCDVVSVGLVR